MIQLLDIEKYTQEAIDKNPDIFEKLMWLSFSELVRLEEINMRKKEQVRDEMDYILTKGAPQDIEVKVEWKKINMNSRLIGAALERKYNELFENTKF